MSRAPPVGCKTDAHTEKPRRHKGKPNLSRYSHFTVTPLDDDAIVVIHARRTPMLWKTYEAFQERLDHAKSADGRWIAEFSGPFRIKVTDSNLER